MLGQVNLAEGSKTANLRFLATELGAYAAGMKALEANDLAAAQAASDKMDAGLWRLEPEDDADSRKSGGDEKKAEEKKDEPPMVKILPDAQSGPLLKCLTIQSLELRAGILVAQGNLDAAKKLYDKASKDEKDLGYHEPPFYIRPVGETEAAALLRAKDWSGATAAYQAALKQRPNSGFGLYGLAQVRELSGDTAGARTAYQAFLKAWPAADAGLPEVVHARKVLAENSGL
jgi:tetratricopeptide (TPR) repeat protein